MNILPPLVCVCVCRCDYGLCKPQPACAQVVFVVSGGASERVPVRHDPLPIHLPDCKHVEIITWPRATFSRAFLTITTLSPLQEPHLESWKSSRNGSRTSEISVGLWKSSRGSRVSPSIVENVLKKIFRLLSQQVFLNHLASDFPPQNFMYVSFKKNKVWSLCKNRDVY